MARRHTGVGGRNRAAVAAACVVLLAGAGLAIALAAVTNDAENTTAAAPTQTAPAPNPDQSPADTPPTASQPTTAPESAGATPTTPPAEDGATPAPEGEAAPPEPAPAPEGWPPGKSAFTVILASMPTESAAQDKLEKARAAGISGAAILHSDDFPTLRPGYWVVFDGQYDTSEQAMAQAEADRAKGEFTDAYPRFVSKNADAQP